MYKYIFQKSFPKFIDELKESPSYFYIVSFISSGIMFGNAIHSVLLSILFPFIFMILYIFIVFFSVFYAYHSIFKEEYENNQMKNKYIKDNESFIKKIKYDLYSNINQKDFKITYILNYYISPKTDESLNIPDEIGVFEKYIDQQSYCIKYCIKYSSHSIKGYYINNEKTDDTNIQKVITWYNTKLLLPDFKINYELEIKDALTYVIQNQYSTVETVQKYVQSFFLHLVKIKKKYINENNEKTSKELIAYQDNNNKQAILQGAIINNLIGD